MWNAIHRGMPGAFIEEREQIAFLFLISIDIGSAIDLAEQVQQFSAIGPFHQGSGTCV
jgi:hypothetical protein